jgi:hypothetical protein
MSVIATSEASCTPSSTSGPAPITAAPTSCMAARWRISNTATSRTSRPRRWRSATRASPRGSPGSSTATPTLQPGCTGTTDAHCGPCSTRPPASTPTRSELRRGPAADCRDRRGIPSIHSAGGGRGVDRWAVPVLVRLDDGADSGLIIWLSAVLFPSQWRRAVMIQALELNQTPSSLRCAESVSCRRPTARDAAPGSSRFSSSLVQVKPRTQSRAAATSGP